MPAVSAENYAITDMELGTGTAKEKFWRNVEAIRTLKMIESEGRMATADEQEDGEVLQMLLTKPRVPG